MAFRFKLASLLGYRRTLEEQAQQALAREQALLAAHRRRLAELEEERRRLVGDFESKKKIKISAPLFTFYMDALNWKDEEIRARRLMIDSQQEAVHRARSAVIERMKARKVIERVREKDHQEYVRETLRREQNENDQHSVLRHGRGTRVHL